MWPMLWYSKDELAWHEALKRYWDFVKPANLALEKKFQSLDIDEIKGMDSRQWYDFLHDEYFTWKFTANYRFTEIHVKKYLGPEDCLENLFKIKEKIFNINREDILGSLRTARQIRGLGVAGAAGLLAVLFPSDFGTVDQFAVKALAQVPNLPERAAVRAIDPKNIDEEGGALLIKIMREKAKTLNEEFGTSFWTPRKIDMILWHIGR